MSTETLSLSLMDDQEREMVEYIWALIPEQDKAARTKEDVLYVLDKMDDYLEEQGLVEVDEQSGEVTYLDGDVDETEQLEWIKAAAKKDNMPFSGEWIQLVMDGELQYGIKQGWYEDID